MKLCDFTQLINYHFLNTYNSLLAGGYAEPLYLPENGKQPAEIRFTGDYFSSALHELAHWCIAGPERRKKIDYGYWYAPDGRTQQQQLEFYKCEVKPQAIECAFSNACGIKFSVSVDNLNNDEVEGAAEFREAVLLQYRRFMDKGFPERAEIILTLITGKEIK